MDEILYWGYNWAPAPALLLLLPCSCPALALLLPFSCPDLTLLLPCSCSAPAHKILHGGWYWQKIKIVLMSCSCTAPARSWGAPDLTLLLVQPCFFLAPAPAHPSLAAFIIISTLWLFSARREPPFMVFLYYLVIDFFSSWQKYFFPWSLLQVGSAVFEWRPNVPFLDFVT